VSQYALGLLSSLIVGIGLGIFYFAGLWLTVKRLPGSQSPALLVLGSFFGRMVVVLPGFYLVMDGHLERLLASVLGFFIVRAASVRLAMPHRNSVPAS
jgi:F1F0 ATPase subunit 2